MTKVMNSIVMGMMGAPGFCRAFAHKDCVNAWSAAVCVVFAVRSDLPCALEINE